MPRRHPAKLVEKADPHLTAAALMAQALEAAGLRPRIEAPGVRRVRLGSPEAEEAYMIRGSGRLSMCR